MSLVLVDGSNVARCAAWRAANPVADDVALRRRLVDAIGSWAARAGHRAFVTFDGSGPWRPGSVRISGEVEVFGTGGVEGDDVIAQRAVSAVRSKTPYWLVTSDRGLSLLAGGGADRTIRADDFVEVELGVARSRSTSGATADRAVEERQPGSRLGESVDDDVRAKLERMRRGLDAGS
jgi:predicted RNA-binding protein with PIN domain